MPASLNRVTLIGNLGRDPDVKQIPSGQTVATFSIATNETFYDKQKQKQTKTEWHNIEVWGKAAELAGQHLTKGRSVLVEGSLRTDQWEKDNQKHSRTKIIARSWQFNDHAEKSEPVEAEPTPPEADPKDSIPF